MRIRQLIMLGVSAAGALAPSSAPAYTQSISAKCEARFVGKLVLSPDAKGRFMTVEAPYGFQDSRCKRWNVPKGAAVDGASIPQVLWSVVGGPWEGVYRNASVLHDWYCSVRTEPWLATHRMFLDAMLASGVGKAKARLMYLAVRYGGPQWSEEDTKNSRLLSSAMLKIGKDVQLAAESAQRSLGRGDLAAAQAQYGYAMENMKTNGDQYLVSSVAFEISRREGNLTAMASALDGMITSRVATGDTLGRLHSNRASVAFNSSDYLTSVRSARMALSIDPDNADALKLVAELEREAPPSVLQSVQSDTQFEATVLEFKRLANIVEAEQFDADQIDELVQSVRPNKLGDAGRDK